MLDLLRIVFCVQNIGKRLWWWFWQGIEYYSITFKFMLLYKNVDGLNLKYIRYNLISFSMEKSSHGKMNGSVREIFSWEKIEEEKLKSVKNFFVIYLPCHFFINDYFL